ncbi:MAG: hypothetical protein HFF60_05560 [Oscillospiraceae bacterium]|jgi:hypothetical protein|nr:hypothetical protein [Oscillospiraceae bacterium]
MNILFQWLWDNSNVIAIVVSLISLLLSIVGFVHSSTGIKKQEKWHRLKKLSSMRYGIFHFIVLLCLTCYILLNWEKCISMQFFSQFDGNNILLLVWIILIFLIIYEVEGKGIKIAEHKKEEVQQDLSDANLKYKVDTMLEQIKNSNPDIDAHQKEERER